MKKRSTIFSLAVAMTILGGSIVASAQGRGNDRKEKVRNHSDQRERNDDKRDRGQNDHDNKDRHRDNDNDNDQYARRGHSNGHHKGHKHGHDHDYRRDVYHYDHNHHPRPVVVHHYARPRYVYYRDYDVYYDCNQSVYISFSGRGWTVTREIPRSMRYVDVRRVKKYRVEYYNDDFPTYLGSNRPTYGSEWND